MPATIVQKRGSKTINIGMYPNIPVAKKHT
jgi:hypothetical protein